jgi:hypothetical protein
MKALSTHLGLAVALAALSACDHGATAQPSSNPTPPQQPASKPGPPPEEVPMHIAREPSLTEVKRDAPKPGGAPPIEIEPNADGQTVTVREFYPAGWLYTERVEKLVEGGKRVRHGPLKAWHENRQLMQIGEYTDGKLSGHWTYWDDQGGRERQGDYDQGLRSGDWREWFPNGQLKSMGLFHVNLAEGPWKFWHDNGQLMGQGEFINNKREGQWMFWLPDGTVDANQTGIYEDNHRVR